MNNDQAEMVRETLAMTDVEFFDALTKSVRDIAEVVKGPAMDATIQRMENIRAMLDGENLPYLVSVCELREKYGRLHVVHFMPNTVRYIRDTTDDAGAIRKALGDGVQIVQYLGKHFECEMYLCKGEPID